MRPILRPKTEMDGSNFGSDFEIQFWIRFLRILWCGQTRQKLSGSKIGSEIGSLGFGLIGHPWADCAKHGNCWPPTDLKRNHSPWPHNCAIHRTPAINRVFLNPYDENDSRIASFHSRGPKPYVSDRPRNTYWRQDKAVGRPNAFLGYHCIQQPTWTRRFREMLPTLGCSIGYNSQFLGAAMCIELASQFILDVWGGSQMIFPDFCHKPWQPWLGN